MEVGAGSPAPTSENWKRSSRSLGLMPRSTPAHASYPGSTWASPRAESRRGGHRSCPPERRRGLPGGAPAAASPGLAAPSPDPARPPLGAKRPSTSWALRLGQGATWLTAPKPASPPLLPDPRRAPWRHRPGPPQFPPGSSWRRPTRKGVADLLATDAAGAASTAEDAVSKCFGVRDTEADLDPLRRSA